MNYFACMQNDKTANYANTGTRTDDPILTTTESEELSSAQHRLIRVTSQIWGRSAWWKRVTSMSEDSHLWVQPSFDLRSRYRLIQTLSILTNQLLVGTSWPVSKKSSLRTQVAEEEKLTTWSRISRLHGARSAPGAAPQRLFKTRACSKCRGRAPWTLQTASYTIFRQCQIRPRRDPNLCPLQMSLWPLLSCFNCSHNCSPCVSMSSVDLWDRKGSSWEAAGWVSALYAREPSNFLWQMLRRRLGLFSIFKYATSVWTKL